MMCLPHLLSTLLLMPFVPIQGGCVGEKIEGGHDAKPHSRPYMVYILYKTAEDLNTPNSKWRSCDGFLVREDFVMSAAHCKGEKMFVFTGVHSRCNDLTNNCKLKAVAHAHPHYSANSVDHANDIMLLKLSQNAELNEKVELLDLPQSAGEAAPTDNCLVPGWGITSFPDGPRPDLLQEVNVTLDSSITCGSNKICSQGSKGPLKGDSGGPLICGNVAYGVVSSYVPKDQTHYYISISHYHHWIQKTMSAY